MNNDSTFELKLLVFLEINLQNLLYENLIIVMDGTFLSK